MDIRQVLLQYWGHQHFRPLQEDIIHSVMAGRDTLALMPTGGGKSICYQVPGLAQDGICVVVSPLIALMKDQVQQLRNRKIKAAAVFSGMTKREIDIVLDNCIYGGYKFLYLSPERLGMEIVQARLEKMKINLLAVDEAHCISQWGYDFRPAYLKIAEIKPLLHGAPILALTATATSKVKKDIQSKLLFPQENLFQVSFERKNICYAVRITEDKLDKALNIFKRIKGSGIVYVRSRKRSAEIAEYLIKNGIGADYYHAGVDMASRHKKQDDWLSGKVRVMVATTAFGMGIDKPDVRIVIHYDLPENIESYYQEAGRVGRDGKRAFAVLLYNMSDKLDAVYRLEEGFPTFDETLSIYNSLGNYFKLAVGSGFEQSFLFEIKDFCNTFNHKASKVMQALKILEQQGLISNSDAVYMPSRLKFIAGREDLYRFQIQEGKYDGLIKCLLRSYAGLFDEFVEINELEIGRNTQLNRKQVMQYLEYMTKTGLVAYEKQSNLPRITYVVPRQDNRFIKLDKAFIAERKAIFDNNIRSMLAYAGNKTKCRSQFILDYFGETDNYRCGACDICIEMNKLGLSDLEFTEIVQEIKSRLMESEWEVKLLIASITRFQEVKVLQTLKWLLENDQVITLEDNHLTWNE